MSMSSTLFPYNVDEMPQERNSSLYQWAYDKIGFVVVSLKVSEFIGDVKYK